MLGLVGIRWRGAYVATKFAMEGLTDVLRLEMADTPIKFILIEPGPITSDIRKKSIPHFERWIDWRASPRRAQYEATLLQRLYKSKDKPDRFRAAGLGGDGKADPRAGGANPRPRYYVTTPTYLMGIARRILPTRALDWLAGRG